MSYKKIVFLSIVLPVLFFGVPCCVYGQNADKVEPENALQKPVGGALLDSPQRKVLLPEASIMKVLKIKPGMTIVDIGAGVGNFTFPIADALKGTGMVYATEISPASVEYLRKKAENGGYKNVSSVLVKAGIADPFYKEHVFDIIFFCDLLPYIPHPENYFRELKASLVKETGRFYVIEPKTFSDFNDIDIDDFNTFVRVIAAKGSDFPVIEKLSPEARDYIRNYNNTEVLPDMRGKIIHDLNILLSDKFLFDDVVDYFAKKYMPADGKWTEPLMSNIGYPEAKYMELIYVQLDDEGVFNTKDGTLTKAQKALIEKLNKTLLFELFHINSLSYRVEQRSPQVILRSKQGIILKMEAAGYTLVVDYDFLPKYYFLEFKRTD